MLEIPQNEIAKVKSVITWKREPVGIIIKQRKYREYRKELLPFQRHPQNSVIFRRLGKGSRILCACFRLDANLNSCS